MSKDITVQEAVVELGIDDAEVELIENLSSPDEKLEEEVEQETDEGYIDGIHRAYSLDEAEKLGFGSFTL